MAPEGIIQRMRGPNSTYYLIELDGTVIGGLRVADMGKGRMQLKQIFILPKHQGHGYAQAAILAMEAMYPHAALWELDTIKQEGELRHLYERMGYRPTGREYDLQEGMTLMDYEKIMV